MLFLCYQLPLWDIFTGALQPQQQHTQMSHITAFVTVQPTASSARRTADLAGDAPLGSTAAGDAPDDVTDLVAGRAWIGPRRRGHLEVSGRGAGVRGSESRVVAAPADPVSFMMKSPDRRYEAYDEVLWLIGLPTDVTQVPCLLMWPKLLQLVRLKMQCLLG